MTTRKNALLWAVIVGLAFCLTACRWRAAEEETVAAAPPPPSLEESIEGLIGSLTPEEKIGQLMMVGVSGPVLTQADKDLLTELKPGGIIFFDRNLESAEQTYRLTADLQGFAAAEVKEKVPLFIAIDEEGGRVARGRSFIPVPPSQQEIGSLGDPNLANTWSATTAVNLKKLGINVNFAPVADISETDSRSFGADPPTVAAFIEAAAAGYRREDFLFTLKHFPGLGRGKADTHLVSSQVGADLALLEDTDMLPFKRAVATTDHADFLIMVSHLIYSALDDSQSATLSKTIMTTLLREQLGYRGLIVTDDMAMGGVAGEDDFARVGLRAVLAGADIVLICHDPGQQRTIKAGLMAALQRGELSEERVNESLRRIFRVKLKHLL